MYNMLHRKVTTLPKGTTVDTSNLQPRELIHMDFYFYNVISILGITSILTVVCEKTRIIWVFPTASKQSPVCIIHLILTTLNNEQHPWKHVIFDEDGALENPTDVTNLLVDELKIPMENTGGDSPWINGKNERNKRSIQNMVRSGLIESNKHSNKWCCAAETSE